MNTNGYRFCIGQVEGNNSCGTEKKCFSGIETQPLLCGGSGSNDTENKGLFKLNLQKKSQTVVCSLI